MDKKQAEKVKKLIDQWIEKQKLYKDDKSVRTEVESDDNYYVVKVYTDGSWYDSLYENHGYYVDEFDAKEFGLNKGYLGEGMQGKLESYVEKKMKFKKEEHYFEPDSGGILIYY